jgi:chromosome segregation ATPase
VADDRLAKQQERQDAIAGFLALVTDLRETLKDERERAKAEAKRAADATNEHRECLGKIEIMQDQMQEERQACRDEIEHVRSSLQAEIDKVRSEVRSKTNPPPAE